MIPPQHRPVKLSNSNFASYLVPSADTELSKDTDCQNRAFHHSGGWGGRGGFLTYFGGLDFSEPLQTSSFSISRGDISRDLTVVRLWKVVCKTAAGHLVVLVRLIGPGIPATSIMNHIRLGELRGGGGFQ